MSALLKRTEVRDRLAATFARPQAIREALPAVELPPPLKLWLTRLALLYGVPFNSLVPDEGMLPPESIRFFYLDMNWVDVLIDGAFSIGRNLARPTEGAPTSASFNLDRAVHAEMGSQVKANLAAIRSSVLGISPAVVSSQVVTGFVLRSSLVPAYPGIGVMAYSAGEVTPRTVLRMERLGPRSDTLICLFDGDVNQVDIHEPPEALHFGIDTYTFSNNQLKASKDVYKFTVSDGTIHIKDKDTKQHIELDNCFRSISPRTLMLAAVAQKIAQANNLASINSAEMGFEMTEGVGMVSFKKATS